VCEPLFVSFEGIDGSGKTTQISRLVAFLEARGREVCVFREPGGTRLGERLRELVLEGDDVVPWAEVSLFAAARAQLVETEIRPALAKGSDVVCDRYLDSSVAYQGLARGLGADAVLEWNLRVTGGLLPRLTFLLTLTAEQAFARIRPVSFEAGEASTVDLDRLERESLEFRKRVEAAYAELAGAFPDRILPIDGTLPPDAIAELVIGKVTGLLANEAAA
jgi:dTMP kinase